MARKLPKKVEQPSIELPIPYESLVGITVTKPILTERTEEEMLGAIANFSGASRWNKWGLNSIRKQGSLIIFTGESGTGKTTIARFLAKKLGKGFICIGMADIGSSDPGQSERNAVRIFEKGKAEGNATILLDECDSILWSRSRVSADSMWMLALINTILTRVEQYEGLVCMASNMDHLLDAALLARATDLIHVDLPPAEVRQNLWENKIPEAFPYQPKLNELKILAKFELTGRDIENCILKEAKTAIRQGRNPKFASLQTIAEHSELDRIQRLKN